MSNFENVLRVLVRDQRKNDLMLRVVARMMGSEPQRIWMMGVDPESVPPTSPQELYEKIIEDLKTCDEHWSKVAEAIVAVTAFDPENAINWLKTLPKACFPLCNDPDSRIYSHRDTGSSAKFVNSNLKAMAIFLGIIQSIEWLDTNNIPIDDGEEMKAILSPFLLEEIGYQIDMSDYGFPDKKEADTFRSRLSEEIHGVIDSSRFLRLIPTIKGMVGIGEMTIDNCYFQSNFLQVACYSVFGTITDTAKAQVVLNSTEFIAKTAGKH